MSSPHPQESLNDRAPNSSTTRSLSRDTSLTTSSFSQSQQSQLQQGGGRRGLAPLTTTLTSTSGRPGSSSTSPRNPWSPVPHPLPSTQPLSARQSSRSTSISAVISPFSPPSAQQSSHASSGQSLQSSRARTTTAGGTGLSSFASSSQHATAASTTNNPGSARVSRVSPSISLASFSSTTPPSISAATSSAAGQSGPLSKIVIAQVFLLLTTLKDEDRAKWESQADQIHKLVYANDVEVFIKYLRRLIVLNSPQMLHASRNAEPHGSYLLLVEEVQKLLREPQTANRIVEAIDGDREAFKDFDLSTFMDHFRMNPLAKTTLSSAFKRATKPDLRSKADAILSNNIEPFLHSLASLTSSDNPEEPSPPLLAAIIDRLAQNPPRNWGPENRQSLELAIQQRYNGIGNLVPTEVSASLMLFDILEPHNSLVRLVQRSGPRATESLERCKAMLEAAELQDISYQQVSTVLLFMVIAKDEPAYNPHNFISALREHRGGQRLDWQDILHSFDSDGIKITRPQFKALFNALMPLAREYENFDVQLLWGGDWHHGETQLTFASAFLSFSQDELDASQIPRLRKSFTIEDFEDGSDEVKAYAESAVRHPFVSFDAAKALFNMVFRSSDTYAHAQSLGVIENVINPRMDLFVCAVSAVPKPWGALQDQAMRQLIDPFFAKNLPGHAFVLHLLQKRDRPWLAVRMQQFAQQGPDHLQFVFEHAVAHNMLDYLISQSNELSLDLATFGHARDLFNLERWLDQMAHTVQASRLLAALSQFLRTRAEDEIQAHRDPDQSLGYIPLSVKTVHLLLKYLGDAGLPEDEQVQLQRSCIQGYPRLINYGEGFDAIIDASGQHGNAMTADADARMQEHYKLMYSGVRQVRDIIEDLQTYKTSEDPAEQDLFACMIFGLFDEYNCFSEYPMDALATTAVLFGSIVNFNLLSQVALKAALAMVLEAVRDHPPQEKMFKFGLQALLHCKDRLPEWPLFSGRLHQVPGLRSTQIEATLSEVVRAQTDLADNETVESNLQEATLGSFLSGEPKPPEFSSLAVDPPLRDSFYEDPDEDVKEMVLFILNNVSERNLDVKLHELKSKLVDEHHQWFANYLVEQRIKPQPNFQQLYQDLLNRFGDKLLWAEVLRESYVCAFRMLNAESTMNSSSERTLLKNLGIWIGSITLARNQPIVFRNISFRDLLVEAHDSQRLIVAIPFTCNVLSMAAKSSIFRAPCSWTMEIVQILVELYRFASLKLQLKFEIEILCKALGVDEKKIDASDAIRSRPPRDEVSLPPPVTDGLDGFGELSIMNLNRRGFSERFAASNIVPELSDISSVLKHNYSITPSSPTLHGQLQHIFTQAVERAVPEIIGPVVERSVTIAGISASQLIAKDFATESDPLRYQESAHNIVRHLAGNLALVTGKDPVRAGVGNNIRLMLAREHPDQPLPEGAVLTFLNDNLDTICGLIEKAAETAAIGEIDSYISEDIKARKSGNFPEPQISRWAYHVPEPYKPSPSGLNQEQLAIYVDFGQTTRNNISHNANTSQDSGRQLPDVLQDPLSTMTNIPVTAEGPPILRQPVHATGNQPLPSRDHASQHLANGYVEGQYPEDRLSILVNGIKNAAEMVDENLYQDASMVGAVEQAWMRLRAFVLAPAQPLQRDNVACQAAANLLDLLCAEHPVADATVVDVLAKVLRLLCEDSDRCKQHVYTIVRSSEERFLNPLVTVALLKHDLLDYRRLDMYIANHLRTRRRDALPFLDQIIDGVLLSEPAAALRADFAHTLTALAQWYSSEPNAHDVQDLNRKLHDSTAAMPDSPLAAESTLAQEAQVEYIFDEWVRLLYQNPHKTSLLTFLRQLQLHQIIATQDASARFLRTCIDLSVATFEKNSTTSISSLDTAYTRIDALAKLMVLLVAYQGPANGTTKCNKPAYFANMLPIIVLVMAQHYRVRAEQFNQKVFFRLLSSLLCELKANAPALGETFDDIILSMVKCLGLLQPQTFPAFSFAWLSLISHRTLMPLLLKASNQAFVQAFCDLLSTHLLYMGELLKPLEISRAAKDLYRGTLEVLLILHHDFPEILVENHFQLLNSIPPHCTQMRSLIISAPASSYPELPDPLVHGLKIDRLEGIQHAPVVRTNAGAILEDFEVKDAVDDIIQGLDSFDSGIKNIIHAVQNPPKTATGMGFVPLRVNEILLNAIVLYIVQQAEASDNQRVPKFTSNSRQALLMDCLMERLAPEARYHFVGAIVNQLRYPNSHTAFFCYSLFHLFRPNHGGPLSSDIQMQIIRVLMERFIVHRPHPWGLIVAILELFKNREYRLWDLSFMKALPDMERLVTTLFSQMGLNVRALA